MCISKSQDIDTKLKEVKKARGKVLMKKTGLATWAGLRNSQRLTGASCIFGSQPRKKRHRRKNPHHI